MIARQPNGGGPGPARRRWAGLAGIPIVLWLLLCPLPAPGAEAPTDAPVKVLGQRAHAGVASSDRKIHPRLQRLYREAAAKGLAPESFRTRVLVWLAVPAPHSTPGHMLGEATRGVEYRPAGVPSPGGSQQEAMLSRINQVEAKNAAYRRTFRAALSNATDRALVHVKKDLGHVVYRFSSAPVVVADLTADECDRLSHNPHVACMYADEATGIENDVNMPASRAISEWIRGITGSGVTIAYIEPEPGLISNIYVHATAYRPHGAVGSHATTIGGIIACTFHPYRGIAYGCNLLNGNAESNTESDLGQVTDWALENGASIIVCSENLKTVEDDGLHWSDVYFDYVVHNQRVLFVKSAGNSSGLSTAGQTVTSPGRGYNVLTVGNVDGKRTLDWSDDHMSPTSKYGNPSTETEKPELCAYGSKVWGTLTAPPWIGPAPAVSGTSFAAPLAGGIAGLCVDFDPDLADEPQALKAKLLVSALSHNIEGAPLPNATDRDGAGKVLASAVRTGHYIVTLQPSDFDTNGLYEIPVDIPLPAGDTTRVAMVYTQPPSSQTAPPDPSSYYLTDLDLKVAIGDTPVGVSSSGPEDPYEIVDYSPASNTTGRAAIYNSAWNTNSTSLRVAVSWASIGILGSGPDRVGTFLTISDSD